MVNILTSIRNLLSRTAFEPLKKWSERSLNNPNRKQIPRNVRIIKQTLINLLNLISGNELFKMLKGYNLRSNFLNFIFQLYNIYIWTNKGKIYLFQLLTYLLLLKTKKFFFVKL